MPRKHKLETQRRNVSIIALMLCLLIGIPTFLIVFKEAGLIEYSFLDWLNSLEPMMLMAVIMGPFTAGMI